MYNILIFINNILFIFHKIYYAIAICKPKVVMSLSNKIVMSPFGIFSSEKFLRKVKDYGLWIMDYGLWIMDYGRLHNNEQTRTNPPGGHSKSYRKAHEAALSR